MLTIYTGDDVSLAVTLKRNGSAFVIDPGATVRAALIQDATITGPVVCQPTATGADWSQSVVVVEIPSATSANAPVGSNALEIEVDDDGKTTFVVERVYVKAGAIV